MTKGKKKTMDFSKNKVKTSSNDDDDYYIFGGPDKKWQEADFNTVDDGVRGGKSQSFVETNQDKSELRFYGNLDIEVLGGLGFASQRTKSTITRTYDLSSFKGLLITTKSGDSKIYQINLRDKLPPLSEDGRVQSSIEYKYSFRGIQEETTIFVDFKDFKPYYRGKPVSLDDGNDKSLDLTNIKEISFMCASLFGKQFGDFTITFVSIVATRNNNNGNNNNNNN